MEEFLMTLIAKYPIAISILAGLYIVSLINKPLFSIFKTIADNTATTKDNEVLATVEASAAYKTICYILDWAVRIKLSIK